MKNILKITALLMALCLMLFAVVGCSDDGDTDTAASSNISSVNDETQSAVSTDDSSNTASSKDEAVTSGDTVPDSSKDSQSNGDSSKNDTTVSSNISNTSTPEPDNSPTVFLTATKNGDTVTVKAAVKNNSGLAGFSFKITYDKAAVTPDKLQKGLVSVVSNLQQSTDCGGEVTAVYSDALGFKDNGDLFSVTFKVKDSKATETTFGIKAESNSFVDQNVQYTTFKTQGTTVKF
ncbi:MAG: hypothetical protein IJA41_09950 [Clostridia bacterium]|nr:hypothetical protein [Clostridia bacterium]